MAYLLLGLFTLWAASEIFVKYSCNVAKEFHVPKYIIGIVITSLGTSLPELVLSVYGALTGHVSMVIGNIVGSNIANIALGLGLLGFLSKTNYVSSHLNFIKTDQNYLFISTLFILAGCYLDYFNRPVALLGLLTMAFFLLAQYKPQKYANGNGKKHDLNIKNITTDLLFVLFASGLIYFGAKWTIQGGVEIASYFNIPEFIIGLITIAVGTSLPEIAVVIIALRRGESSLALGNIIGSNVYNVCFILALTGMITPISIDLEFADPIVIYLCLLTVLTTFFIKYLATRTAGLLLLISYIVFVAWNFY